MQINKKIIICTLLILTIFSIMGSVNASDTLNKTSTIKESHTNNNIITDSQSNMIETNNPKENSKPDNDNKEISQNKEKITVDDPNPQTNIYVSTTGSKDKDGKTKENATTLNNAFTIAQNGSTIHITEGIYQTEYLGSITEKIINITGEGQVTLDAKNNNRLFYIGDLSKVVIRNINMINGYTSEDDSGALIGNSGNLTIINCSLTDSTSYKNGGAIYNAGNLIIINSTFENNYAERCGGAIFSQNSATGIIPTLNIDNSQFKNNNAKGYTNYCGGAVYIQGSTGGGSLTSANIKNTLFENNNAIDYGGGAIEITVTLKVNIDNCTFINNSANGELYQDKSDYGGGAISFIGSYGDLNELLTITNSLFINNTVKNYGGGAIYTRYAKVDIKNSVLINNTDEAKGYAIYRRSTDINTAKVTANDNWWGSNTNPKYNINAGTLSRWVILTITNTSEIKAGELTKILVSLNNYTTGFENGTLTNPMIIERPVTIYTNLGTIKGKLVNGEFNIDYPISSDLKIISTQVDDEEQVLFAITSPTNLELTNITGHMGNRIEYNVKVKNENTPINKGNVEIYFDNDLVATIPVSNSEAKGTIMINKNIGKHTITAKFIDLTKEFENDEKNATLTVNGIDNIVTKETYNNFFDEENNLKSDIPFDEIFFKGTIENKILNINKQITLTGNNTLFNNTIINILVNNVKLQNISFISNKNFDDESIIYSYGQNTIIKNNKINYNAPNTANSYAIYLEYASKSEIINNTINYIASLGDEIQTIPFYTKNSENLLIKDNIFDIKIPSIGIVDTGEAPYYYGTANSAGLVFENCKKLILNNNTININYNGFDNYGFDTINGIHIKFCDNSQITNNKIKLKGHSYSYPLYIDGSENIEISKNNIHGESELDQTNTISINGKTSANITNNNIIAIANTVVYPIYLNDLTYQSKAIIRNNTINGKANIVYGIYTEENSTTITSNNIEVNGSYTIGITSYKTNMIIKNNTVTSQGTNNGNNTGAQAGIPVETTAITLSNANIEVDNNKLTSTGDYTINTMNSTGNVVNNNLRITSGATGDITIKQSNSNLIIDNNKTSPQNSIPVNPDTPKSNDDKPDTPKSSDDKPDTPKSSDDKLDNKNPTNEYKQKTSKTTKPKQIIVAKNLKVKKSNKNLKIKVKLKKLNKKILKNKKVTLKLKGKTYTRKTNKKGIAIFKIPKKVIKKLKPGKTYKYIVKYQKYKLTKKINIKK